MSALILASVVAAYRAALTPLAPFAWAGLPFSALDVAAALRLTLVLRQLRESLHFEHVRKQGGKRDGVEERSFVRDLTTTLVVVYGGEAVTAPLLNQTPSFMLSPAGLILYAGAQLVIDRLPAVPMPAIQTEGPLAIVDAFTRAFLLCNLIPPAVVSSANAAVADSPWTLLLSSLMVANGGFFFTSALSLLHPTPLSLRTPPELLPYGWTTTDLWCAPLVTGLYALLTHASPAWAALHTALVQLLGGQLEEGSLRGEKVVLGAPSVDAEVARAGCVVLLAGLFLTRAVRNFGGVHVKQAQEKVKEKTQ